MNGLPQESPGNMPVSLLPWLAVKGGAKAVAFYQTAFNAVEVYRLESAEGEVVARLAIGEAEFWLSDESPGERYLVPGSERQVSVRMILSVTDPDFLFAQALRAGAREIYPVSEDHGWRIGRLEDPFGHHWEIGRPL
jgi:PhnB protein